MSPARSDDWPQWRGLQRDGVWRETGIVESIPAGGLPVKWHARVLNGWSGPAVAAGRVYLTDHSYKSDPEVERVLCFDAETGKPLWKHEYPCPYGNMEYGNGPRATPTVQDGLVYALGTFGHLHCLNAETGAVVWKKEPTELDLKIPTYGVSASPLIEGDVVIITAGSRPNGTVTAFDRKTGAEKWRALDDRPAYSSPIVVEKGGRRQAIVWTGDNVSSLDPQTGELIWQIPYKAKFDPAQATASPVIHQDKLLCLAGWNRGSLMLQLDQDKPGASIFWQTRTNPTANSSTPVFQHEKYIYTVVNDGALVCLDAATGDELWQTRDATSERFGMGHLVTHGDRCWILNQQGHLILSRLTPEGYHELGRMLLVEPTAGYRVGGAVCWSHPAYANRHVFARNDHDLVCVSLAADATRIDSPLPKSSISSVALPDTGNNEMVMTASVCVAPDGKTIAVASTWGLVKQYDFATGVEIPSMDRHTDNVCTATYSSDGKYLVSAGGSEFTPVRNGGKTKGDIKVWDRQAGMQKPELIGHTNKVFTAAFSPDGKTLASGSADRTIRLWDIDAMQEKRVLKGHGDAILSLAWTPNGKKLASASGDGTVKLWDGQSGELLATLAGSSEELLTIAISPNGKWLVAGGSDWKVRLWDLASQDLVAEIPDHQGTIYAAAFSPDGKTLATGSADETIRLWNLETKKSTDVLRGHRSGITALAYTPDGSRLISGALNDPVRVWTLTQ